MIPLARDPYGKDLEYAKVPLGETSAGDFLRNHRVKLSCVPIFLMIVVLFFVPCTPLMYLVSSQVKDIISSEGLTFTGSTVDVSQVCLGFTPQADIVGMEIASPAGFPTTSPHFLTMDNIHVEVGWNTLWKSSLNLVEINDLTMQNLTVHVVQRPEHGDASNQIIMANIESLLASGGSSWAEKFVMDKNRKYIIKRMSVPDMRVLVYSDAFLLKDIKAPPQVVQDLGVLQHGVSFKDLFHLVVQSLTFVSVEGATGVVMTQGP